MSTTDAKKIVKKYANFLKQNKFPFSHIYLFGSYARGNFHRWSDVDVCVISGKFQGKNSVENKQQLWRWTREVDPRIEPFGLSTQEFKSGISPMAHQVKSTGIKIV